MHSCGLGGQSMLLARPGQRPANHLNPRVRSERTGAPGAPPHPRAWRRGPSPPCGEGQLLDPRRRFLLSAGWKGGARRGIAGGSRQVLTAPGGGEARRRASACASPQQHRAAQTDFHPPQHGVLRYPRISGVTRGFRNQGPRWIHRTNVPTRSLHVRARFSVEGHGLGSIENFLGPAANLRGEAAPAQCWPALQGPTPPKRWGRRRVMNPGWLRYAAGGNSTPGPR